MEAFLADASRCRTRAFLTYIVTENMSCQGSVSDVSADNYNTRRTKSRTSFLCKRVREAQPGPRMLLVVSDHFPQQAFGLSHFVAGNLTP